MSRIYKDFDEFRHDSYMEKDCENCSDGCTANRTCDGCDELLCERCWKEHNAVHFDDLNEAHEYCCCDECIDKAFDKEAELNGEDKP